MHVRLRCSMHRKAASANRHSAVRESPECQKVSNMVQIVGQFRG